MIFFFFYFAYFEYKWCMWLSRFVWQKKIDRDVAQGVPLDMFSVKAEKKRQIERMLSWYWLRLILYILTCDCDMKSNAYSNSCYRLRLKKVKKRREERAIEKAQHEEEMAMIAREGARAEFQDWEKKEEEFYFDQSKVRSEIRLREGCMKPIDVLSKHLNNSDDMDIDLNEPYMVFKFAKYGLTVKEMEEFHEDIKMHLDLDRATPTHIVYWEALMVVCDCELPEARKKDALDRARVSGEERLAELLAEERGLHSSIEADDKNLLEGKTQHVLEALQSQIESQMRTGTAKVVEYWRLFLNVFIFSKQRYFCLDILLGNIEIHAKMLRKHLRRLEQPSKGEDRPESDHGIRPGEEDSDHDVKDAEANSPEPILQEKTHEVDEKAGSFSLELLHGDENEEAIDPEEDMVILEKRRIVVLMEQQR
ncbi:hypothetical protein REPUB_Repub02eG0231900 [Reevesia pubescens]